MCDTIETSLRSILDQVNNQYEVLVIDDGSIDGSIDVIRRLEKEYSSLRHIIGENNNIAEARNQSFREARGEYILESLDTDDRYDDAIQDFVSIFHQLRNQIDREFYLKGHSINVASKKLMLDFPYRSMTYGEDPDRWRRLFAANKIIWIQHEPFYEELAPDDPATQKEKSKMIRTAEFRSGVTFWSYVAHYFDQYKLHAALYQSVRLIQPYLIAVYRGRYTLPDGYEKKSRLNEDIQDAKATLRELEERYDFHFDKSVLSNRGQEIFIENVEQSPLTAAN